MDYSYAQLVRERGNYGSRGADIGNVNLADYAEGWIFQNYGIYVDNPLSYVTVVRRWETYTVYWGTTVIATITHDRTTLYTGNRNRGSALRNRWTRILRDNGVELPVGHVVESGASFLHNTPVATITPGDRVVPSGSLTFDGDEELAPWERELLNG